MDQLVYFSGYISQYLAKSMDKYSFLYVINLVTKVVAMVANIQYH